MPNIPEPTRAWLYRVLVAVVTLAAIYGLIGEDEVTGWVALVAALLGNGLSTVYTSTDP